MDAGQEGAWAVQHPVSGAGGENKVVVVEHAFRGFHRPFGPVDGQCANPCMKRDVLIEKEGRASQRQGSRLLARGEVVL